MKWKWRDLSIKLKIILTGIFIISTFSIFNLFYFIPHMEESIVAKKKEKLRQLTELSMSCIHHAYRSYQDGIFPSEKAAQRAAISQIKNFRYGPENKDYLWINDFHPRMVMHPYRPDLDGKDLSGFKDPRGKHLFKEFVKVCTLHGSGYVSYMWQWKDDASRIVEKISYVKSFNRWGWIIGTGMYIQDVKKEVRGQLVRLLLITFVIMGLSIAVLIFTARTISRPVSLVAETLAESDLNTQLEISGCDEIGTMSVNFNEFVGGVKDIICNIRDVSNMLAASSEQVSCAADSFTEHSLTQNKSVEEVIATVRVITEEMDEININIASQFTNLSHLAGRVGDLSSLINNLDTDIKTTLDEMEDISGRAHSGEQHLKEMYQSIKKVGERSKEVTSITRIIDDISEQINLLSLNAAIEAARAGDAGRGFAVVADEISKLADKTAESIKSISTIITENDKEIEATWQKVDYTVESISFILDGINSVSNMIRDISVAMQKQVGTKESVNQEVQSIKNMSEDIQVTTRVQKAAILEISNLVQAIGYGAEIITSGAEELTSSSEEVASMAVQLKNRVAHFKV